VCYSANKSNSFSGKDIVLMLLVVDGMAPIHYDGDQKHIKYSRDLGGK